MITKTDKLFMRRAISLAKGGVPFASPNPLVGALLVKGGAIIGEGFHHFCGGLHAEREAFADCKKRGFDANGATLYVTLEPCCHTGRQPPCTDAIIAEKVSRVVIGSRDPNPLVAGRGVKLLRERGLKVTEGVCSLECDALNPIFFHWISEHTPFVAIKTAQTLDGFIATKAGHSRWITSERARAFSHQQRNRYSAIAIGVNTVLADDPLLNCRLSKSSPRAQSRNPVRLIFDTALRTPTTSRLCLTAKNIPTLIIHSADTERDIVFAKKAAALKNTGVQLLKVEKDESGHASILEALKKLSTVTFCDQFGKRTIDSVLIEGGSGLQGSAIRAGLVNRIYAFVAPMLFLGDGKKSFGGEGVDTIEAAPRFKSVSTKKLGEDVLLTYDKL